MEPTNKPSLTITSYLKDKPTKYGRIIQDSAVQYAKVTDALNARVKGGDSMIVFVQAEAAILENVRTFLSERGLSLYPTKQTNRFVLGSKRREDGPQIECAIA